MKKRILLISYNFSPELTGIGKYNGEMIDWLLKQGHDCSVLTAYPYYPDWKIQAPYQKKRFLFSTEHVGKTNRLKIYRCPIYVPADPSGFKRILLELSFLITAFLRSIPLLFVRRYDLVIAVAPSFYVGIFGVIWKKLRGASFLYHIQDLQIEAARDLKMIKSKRVINSLLFIEKMVMNNATLVSSISEQMVSKIKSKTKSRVEMFPNWTSTNDFYPIENKEAIKESYGFKKTDKIILYSGAIGEKQGLESILQLAIVYKKMSNVKFLICGNGPYKEKLTVSAKLLGLENIIFYPLQPLSTFNHFLNLADVHLIIQKASAGDLVMPSKLGAILAVGGCCVITANSGTSLYTLVQKYQMGILAEADNQQALEEGLSQALSGDVSQMKINARQYAEAFLSIDTVMRKLQASLGMNLNDKELGTFARTLEPTNVFE